jgi:hypothetical protein
VALGRSRLGIVRPDNFTEGNGERWRLRSQASHTNCFAPPFWPGYANGLTGTVAADDPSPLRLFLEIDWRGVGCSQDIGNSAGWSRICPIATRSFDTGTHKYVPLHGVLGPSFGCKIPRNHYRRALIGSITTRAGSKSAQTKRDLGSQRSYADVSSVTKS